MGIDRNTWELRLPVGPRVRRRWMRRTRRPKSPLCSEHGGGLVNGNDSMNAASRVRVLGGVHGDDPSREDAPEEHDTKTAIAGMRRH